MQLSLTFSRPAKPVSVQEIAISSSTLRPCIAASAGILILIIVIVKGSNWWFQLNVWVKSVPGELRGAPGPAPGPGGAPDRSTEKGGFN